MVESIPFLSVVAINSEGTIVPKRSPKRSRFGKVAKALWPNKTAAELAFRARCTERAAKYWIAGQREPSSAAIAAVVAEMLG